MLSCRPFRSGPIPPTPSAEVHTSSAAFIICSDLTFSWPDDTPVFRDLIFTLGLGRTGLVAPNGAGKSTLLRLIAGEYRPDDGSITVEGHLGYLAQSLPLSGDLTAAEVLGIADQHHPAAAVGRGPGDRGLIRAPGGPRSVRRRCRRC